MVAEPHDGANGDALARTLPGTDPGAARQRLLHYELLELLGRGGMGEVYRARDLRLQRIVAIKRVAPSAGLDAGLAQRLVQEARAASALSHPHIVTVHAIEEAPDGAFLVMEHLDGEPLDQRLARGPLPAAELAELGAQIADALACAHAAGLVHRDIKPGNVMLTGRGAKVLDFGIARHAAAVGALTHAGAVVGTWPYMAPEQVRGEPVDHRADQFALGATLYQAATGQLPFPAREVLALAHQITSVAPVPPRALEPTVPAWFEEVVLRALAKAPGDRFEDAAALARALRAQRPAPPPAEPAAAPGGSSLAVLPFRDLSAERDQGFFCDGIAEELLATLAAVRGLKLAARGTSFQFRGDAVDARAVGRATGVAWVLEGAVRKAADRLRVTVQLASGATGEHRWSRRFDGSTHDVCAIQDEIALGVAEAMSGLLTDTDRVALRRPETSPQAYDHYLRGLQLYRQNTKVALEGGVVAFERALELDPAYAPAHAALAQLQVRRVEWFGGGAAALASAARSSERAVALAPGLAECRVARARVLEHAGDDDGALAEFEAALRANERAFDAHYYLARLCVKTGRDARAVEAFRRAGALQEEDIASVLQASIPLERLGRRDEALEAARAALARAEQQLRLDPLGPRALAFASNAQALLGDRARAVATCERMLSLWPDDPLVAFNAAVSYGLLGEHDRALGELERSFAGGYGSVRWLANDIAFDGLRHEPRYQALVERYR